MGQKPHLRWRAALRQQRVEAEAWGYEAGSIRATHSVCSGFLAANKINLDSQFGAGLLDQMEAWLAGQDAANARFVIVSNGTDRSSQRSRIRDLFRACRALLVEDFAEFFRARLKRSPFTYAQISAQTGIPVLKIKTWLAYNSRFVADMTAEQAKKLDAVLGADRQFFAVYAAMSQEFAFQDIVSAADKLLDRIPLGRLLRACRKKSGLRKTEVIDLLKREGHLALLPERLAAWEQGKSIPCREMLEVVTALDALYRADGQLLDHWLNGNPRITYGSYALRFGHWPRRAQKQFKKLEKYKRRECDQVSGPGSQTDARCLAPPSGKPRSFGRNDRWSSEATVLLIRSFYERFFGYLCQERGFREDQLSITLLCDWDLVLFYFEWVRRKTGRARHGVVERNIAKILACVYATFMPQLHGDAAHESHWRNLPGETCEKVEVIEGVMRDQVTPLVDAEQRWEAHLYEAYHRCKQFYRHKRDFEPSSYVDKAQAVLDAEISLEEISSVARSILEGMPTRILCRKTAILLRRLAVVALLLARAFRPGTLRRLRREWFTARPSGKIVVKIPERVFKQRGGGGSAGGIEGELSDIGWINEAITRWIEEGRPFLTGEAGASVTEGYLLLASSDEGAAADKPFCRKLLELDSLALLGYSPYEHRYIFATDALNSGIEPRDAAITMQNTAPFVKQVYSRMSPEQRGRIHNDIMAFLAMA